MNTKNRRSRRGLSLTEVLIATFVMAVGLLSLASLIPVGLHEVAMANRAQNASHVGRQAWREIKVRDWLRPVTRANVALWYRANNSAINLMAAPPYNAFAIDPLFLSAPANILGTYPNIEYFPYVSGTTPASANLLPRISLKASPHDSRALVQAAYAVNVFEPYPAADRLFTANNDLVFDPINPVSKAKADRPSRVYHNPTGNAVDAVPQFAGDYSWMMTVNPSPADPGRLYTVSVVVFYKRLVQLPSLDAAAQLQYERAVTVSNFYAGGVAGGDINITWPAGETPPKIRAGQWLMLVTGNISGTPNPVRCSWYRVTGVDDDPSDGAANRDLTITGADWPVAALAGQTTYAALFETVVGVYEKTIQIE